MLVNKDTIDYWHDEIGDSIDGLYTRMGNAECDEMMEEMQALEELVELARQAINKTESEGKC